MPHANKPIIKHKTELLHLAEELGNISRVCKVKGLSRDTFYHHRELVDDGDQVHISSDNGARLVLIAGEPLKEPMARGGPVNTP